MRTSEIRYRSLFNNMEKARKVAERLRRMTEEASILLGEQQSLHFTVSIGVAALPEEYADIDTLLQ